MKHALLAGILLAAFSAAAAVPNLEKEAGIEARAWADSVYSTLTLKQRVAQLVIPAVVPGTEYTAAAIRRLVGRDGCGGLIFTKASLDATATAIKLGEDAAKLPLLITVDGEWGLSMRIEGTPQFPKNMTLGAISDYSLIYEYGKEVARECRLLGADVNYSPVADINSNPQNPIIGHRSFGEDPDRVATAVAAYSLGLEAGGIQAVAKHFPGHGNTDTDSHETLPVVNHSRNHLDSIDLVPFKSFIDVGCSGVMVGHLSVPTLDASGTPASMSNLITDELLRREFGFEGLIYTDGLGMQGAQIEGTPLGVAALKAGADVLLYPNDVRTMIKDIVAAVKSGTLDEKIIEDRCKRLLRYKYLLKCNEKPQLRDRKLAQAINSPEADALIKRLAAASITVAKDSCNLLPIGGLADKKIAVVNIGAKKNNDFMRTCQHYADISEYVTFGETFSAATLSKICTADIVIAAAYNDKAITRAVMSQLANAASKLAAVFFMTPYQLQKFSDSLAGTETIVLGYENTSAQRVSAAEALFGGIDVSGRLPVNIPGIAAVGAGKDYAKSRLGFSSPVAENMQSWLVDSIDALVHKGLKTEAFPGCQVLVARNGNIVFNKSYGKKASGQAAKVDNHTIYDLASVSKAVGTLPGIMKAYDCGLLTLDDSLSMHIPELTDSAKRRTTIRELLYHESGMPAALNMYGVVFDTLSYTGRLITRRPDAEHSIQIQRNAYGNNTAKLRTDITSRSKSKRFPIEAAKGIFVGAHTYDTIMSRIYNIPLRKTRDYRYSCLNFCLLMDIEQRRTASPHDIYVNKEIFAPLGAYRTGYRPTEWAALADIAPTEDDTFIRRQTLRGYVHDETANFSGGVQGNAGLFSNAEDIAKLCQMLLNGGCYGDARVLSQETVELFTKSKSPTCRRGLGFDKPDTSDVDTSPTCEEAGAAVFGHLGFTGTVFWVDPDEQLIFVFLTNCINPTRSNRAFRELNIRPHLYSIVCRSLNK